MSRTINLRPWQSKAIAKCLKWFLLENKKRFLINAAPGSGKTICASVIAKELLDKKKIDRVIVIAPRNEVVKQWAEEYEFVTNKFMMKVTSAWKTFEAGNPKSNMDQMAFVKGYVQQYIERNPEVRLDDWIPNWIW